MTKEQTDLILHGTSAGFGRKTFICKLPAGVFVETNTIVKVLPRADPQLVRFEPVFKENVPPLTMPIKEFAQRATMFGSITVEQFLALRAGSIVSYFVLDPESLRGGQWLKLVARHITLGPGGDRLLARITFQGWQRPEQRDTLDFGELCCYGRLHSAGPHPLTSFKL